LACIPILRNAGQAKTMPLRESQWLDCIPRVQQGAAHFHQPLTQRSYLRRWPVGTAKNSCCVNVFGYAIAGHLALIIRSPPVERIRNVASWETFFTLAAQAQRVLNDSDFFSVINPINSDIPCTRKQASPQIAPKSTPTYLCVDALDTELDKNQSSVNHEKVTMLIHCENAMALRLSSLLSPLRLSLFQTCS
jgi:hypothetical protein